MMFGVVSEDCEAIVKVTIGPADDPKVTIDALIDTGFTSFLALPRSTIGLHWASSLRLFPDFRILS